MSEQNRADETAPNSVLVMKIQHQAQVLIVCDHEVDAESLRSALHAAGLACECVRTLSAACACLKSGAFQVVFSSPYLEDGSWRHLVDLAHHPSYGYELVLLARTFSDKEWAEALQEGVYDVLDVLSDLPRAAEVARRAQGADYLRRFGPRAKAA